MKELTHYRMFLYGILIGDFVSKEEKKVAASFRHHYEITDKMHEDALKEMGWTVVDWERGSKKSGIFEIIPMIKEKANQIISPTPKEESNSTLTKAMNVPPLVPPPPISSNPSSSSKNSSNGSTVVTSTNGTKEEGKKLDPSVSNPANGNLPTTSPILAPPSSKVNNSNNNNNNALPSTNPPLLPSQTNNGNESKEKKN